MFHPFPPVYDANSTVLILGSFPSIKSREDGFFYGHPPNRFWAVLAEILKEPKPTTIDEQRAFLLRNGIALWDVIGSCEITNSADSTIRHAVPNDLSPILSTANIRIILLNGKTAMSIYRRYGQQDGYPEAICLPSTSPANAAASFADLVEAWGILRDYLEK
jgi:hypoxanthine-DNA glycosylase